MCGKDVKTNISTLHKIGFPVLFFSHPLLPQERWFRNYKGITLNAIAAMVYNARLLSCIGLEVEKIFRKNQTSFRCNRTTTLLNLKNHRWSTCRISWNNTIIQRFPRGIWFHTKRKDWANTACIWSPQTNGHHYELVSKVGDCGQGWPEGTLFQEPLHRVVEEGATIFPGFFPFTLDPYLIMLTVKQGSVMYYFLSL